MDPLTALATASAISAALGVLLHLVIRGPLSTMLQQNCPGDDTVNFWSRFTSVMLVLSPLFVAVAFGLPQAELIPKTDTATILVRIITSSLVGGFLAMIGMGLWAASLARRYAMFNRQ